MIWERLDKNGQSTADPIREARGTEPEFLRLSDGQIDKDEEDVGCLGDPLFGMTFVNRLGAFFNLFENPTEKSVRKARGLLVDVLWKPQSHPLSIMCATDLFPEEFCRVMKWRFRYSRFNLPEDLDRLLAKWKRDFEIPPSSHQLRSFGQSSHWPARNL